METIEVPVSWLRGTKWYARLLESGLLPTGLLRDGPTATAQEMRERGYIINERTWPKLRWNKGDR